MTTRNYDERVIIYLVNRKIAANMKMVKIYSDKADFPKTKLLAQNNRMRQVRQLFVGGFITFDEAVKSIANEE